MPSTLFFNGVILTMDAESSTPQAVLIEGETIWAIGAESVLRAQMPTDTQEFDLKGRTLMPAFIDPHGHFPDPGLIRLFRVDLSSPPRGGCPNMATAMQRIQTKVDATPNGEWVMGVLFDNTAIAERRMPTRHELDAISEAHPIWVLHASGHNGVANSLALKKYGIEKDTPDPPGGCFVRDTATGELTGLIEGLSAMGEMGNTDFLIDRIGFRQGFAACRDEYLSEGVTYAQNAWVTKDLLAHFASITPGADTDYDLMLLPVGELEPALTLDSDPLVNFRSPYLTLGPRKLFTDGAFQLGSAFLSEPYHKPIAPSHPRGVPYMATGAFFDEVKKLHNLGLQIHCHCNGDAGADMFIDALESVLEENPRPDHRHTIIHGQVLRHDQLERMAQLGITVSFFSAHIYYWGERHFDTFLGASRAEKISPAASAERFGIRYTIHNDASVTPTRPIHLAHCAVNRLTPEGRVLGKKERISVMSALRAQTINAAWQVFQENVRGSIEVGKLADFVVLNRNPLHEASRLLETKVMHTIRRGKCVWQTSSD